MAFVENKLTGNILVVDDNADVLLAAEIVLKKEFSRVQTELDPARLGSLLAQSDVDVVLLDMNFALGATSGQDGLDWLKFIKTRSPATQVIVMTAYGSLNLAIAAIKGGATDFVIKPWENTKLVATLGAALAHSRTMAEVLQLKTRQKLFNQFIGRDFGQIIGQSPALQELLANIDKVAATDANVLILGENGTGKELIARALHAQSGRAEQAFINVDLGAITPTLFESELFGHAKGAFTDAHNARSGRFEIASGGSLFLDEIGNIDMQMQAKLLGVLESRSVSRVGSDKPIAVDVRLISATNMPLYDMVEDYRFRQDLLYRINTVELHVPSLRERASDIPLLAEHFIELFSRKYHKPLKRLSAEALRKLQAYAWPGNIRELQHAVERALIMGESNELQADDFAFASKKPGQRDSINLNLEAVEKDTIHKALIKHQNNLSRAAAELGLGRATLYRKMSKYGIQ
ncbi:MAG: sigma-54 dependent transcriptional regulator [Pseudomonadales bacterium]|jgi:DNA-binding NtrC family response regulator|nr:sigma-54 dependent transcriptional regulator [Pseudomonadales bacterium]